MSTQDQKLEKDIRELRGQMENSLQVQRDFRSTISMLSRNVGNITKVVTNVPAAPVSNLLWNGELGHSVNTWFDSVAVATDKNKECAHWFSHDESISGLLLDLTDARTSSTNKTLKTTLHSTYDRAYSRWNSSNGWAEINGKKTVDALLPANFVDATTPLARVALIAARRSPYIEIPNAALMFAGIYDNTVGQLKFLTGSLSFTAVRIGAVGTTERRFKIRVLSDRGYELVSPEVIITDAPSDAQFSASRNISLSWKATAGQLRVDIYEYQPAIAEYRLIEEVSSGFAFIYQGSFLRTVLAYPVSAVSERTSVYYTRTGEMANLATDQLSPQWDTINFPILVPDNYNKAATTGRQWVRIGLTEKCNLKVGSGTTNGTTTYTTVDPVFDAQYAADYVGLTAEIYVEATGVVFQTTTVVARLSDTTIQLTATVPVGSGRGIRLIGGGFHGIYMDKIHLGYQQNTSYAPNASDVRTLQPLAAPTSSSQGGSSGVSGGGIFCVAANTPIKQADSSWKTAEHCNHGEFWASAEFYPNLLIKLNLGFEFVRQVESANGCFIECTDTERFACDRNDSEGTPLHRLRIGDSVLTEIDGRIVSSKLVRISPYSAAKTNVYTPVLSRNRLFIAGKLNTTVFKKIIGWAYQKLFGKSLVNSSGGFVLHNRKEELIIE